jgi:hypothetical protein
MPLRPAPFIVGVERSGTTLLRLMLDSHRDIAIPFETHFLHKLSAVPGHLRSKQNLCAIIASSPSWANFHLTHEDLIQAIKPIDDFDFSKGCRAFYALCARRQQKAIWGDKTPFYLNVMQPIEQLLPEAHFLHIVRDGRDVALSFRGLWFGPGDDVEACARHWVERLDFARALSPKLRRYLEVRYEDLVVDTERTLRKIADFIEAPFDPAMLNYQARAQRRLSDIVAPFGPNGGSALPIEVFRGIHANTLKPPLPERIGRWRTEMTADQLAQFERIAAPALERYGYPLAS